MYLLGLASSTSSLLLVFPCFVIARVVALFSRVCVACMKIVCIFIVVFARTCTRLSIVFRMAALYVRVIALFDIVVTLFQIQCFGPDRRLLDQSISNVAVC